MADANATVKLQPANYCVVKGSMSAGKNKDQTKDGKDHSASVIVLQMDTCTDKASYDKALAKYFTQATAIESGASVILITSKGEEVNKASKSEFAEGRPLVVAGKDIHPLDYKSLGEAQNEKNQNRARGKMQTFLNTFKKGAGESGGTQENLSASDLADN